MAKVKRILVVVVSVMVAALAVLPLSHGAKKPVTVARKEDIPYIKCQVCQKLAAQLYHQVHNQQARIAPNKVLFLSSLSLSLSLVALLFESDCGLFLLAGADARSRSIK